MKKFAVYQARTQLARARHAVAELKASTSFDEVRRTWVDFLNAADGVFVKLQKGAQNEPTSMGWYGRLKHRRKKDELLAYIHQARRVERHGLNFSTVMGAPTLEWVSSDYKSPPGSKGKEVTVKTPDGRRHRLIFPTTISLQDIVDDQYGDTYHLPTSHLGKPLTSGTMADLAELAISTMEGIINEAYELIPPKELRGS